MIARIHGRLVALAPGVAQIELGAIGLTHEILIPAYLDDELEALRGREITLHTLEHLESVGQGASFIPRLIGFTRAPDRRFFELFTTVKGLGTRRALRALAAPPAEIARAIVARDARSLTKLPEIGKRLAETILVDLSGKVDAFLTVAEHAELEGAANIQTRPLPDGAREAIAALEALGESPADAERLVRHALADSEHPDTQSLVRSALRGREIGAMR